MPVSKQNTYKSVLLLSVLLGLSVNQIQNFALTKSATELCCHLWAMQVCCAIICCIDALLVLVLAKAAAAQQHLLIPHYACNLKLQGNDSQTSAHPIAAATLTCTSPTDSGPMPVAVNSTYVGQYAVQFQGVQMMQGSACQEAAESAEGALPTYALLYFCGNYMMTLDSCSVEGVRLQHDSHFWKTAVLLLGQGVSATFQHAIFANNIATHIIYTADNASLNINDSAVSGNNVRKGLISAPDTAVISITSSIFNLNTASSAKQDAAAAGVSLDGSSNLTVRNSSFLFGSVITVVGGVVADGGAVAANGNSQVNNPAAIQGI